MSKEIKGLFARIPLQNIKFEDPYEQLKFEKMKSTDPDKVIDYLENTLKEIIVTISFNY